jgi:hypothetical protein
VQNGGFSEFGTKILGINGYDLMQPPMNFSEFAAVCTLCDLKIQGPSSSIYKFCYYNIIKNADDPECVKRVLDAEKEYWEQQNVNKQ